MCLSSTITWLSPENPRRTSAICCSWSQKHQFPPYSVIHQKIEIVQNLIGKSQKCLKASMRAWSKLNYENHPKDFEVQFSNNRVSSKEIESKFRALKSGFVLLFQSTTLKKVELFWEGLRMHSTTLRGQDRTKWWSWGIQHTRKGVMDRNTLLFDKPFTIMEGESDESSWVTNTAKWVTKLGLRRRFRCLPLLDDTTLWLTKMGSTGEELEMNSTQPKLNYFK